MDNYNWNNAFLGTPKSFKNRVSATLSNLPDQNENGNMEDKDIYINGIFKKRFIIALVAAMILGTTVFAAGKISSITSTSQGSKIPDYTTIPTVEQVKKDSKFTPKLVNKFDNGYTFANGCTINNNGTDDKGNSVAKTKSLDFTYTKGNDKLDLYMENQMLGERSKKETVIANYNSTDLYYRSYANKSVPEDYKMTEQDKKDKLSGKYVFSYGSDKEEISQVKYLNWMQDGTYYSFLAIDSNISQDELVKMAEQIINTK